MIQKRAHPAGTAQLPKHMVMLDAQTSKEGGFSSEVTENLNHLKGLERNITRFSVIIDSKIKYLSRAW